MGDRFEDGFLGEMALVALQLGKDLVCVHWFQRRVSASAGWR